MSDDWTVGRSLESYQNLYYCISFVLPGLSFVCCPIFAITAHCCLSPKTNRKPTEHDEEDNIIGCEISRSEIIRICKNNCNCKDCNCNCDCNINCKDCNCNCNCKRPTREKFCTCFAIAEFMLKATIATSQFFFGSTTIKLKDKISHNQRCVKIGSGYYKLSFYTLLPLVWSNACVLASLISVFCAFFLIKETSNCDESLDCFLADESNKVRITNCSMILEEKLIVKCYEISFQAFYALSFIGGLLKFVPILFKFALFFFVNKLSKKTWCRCCCCGVNILVPLITLAAIAFLIVLLFKHHMTGFLTYIQIHMIMTMKRTGLSMSIVAQVGCIFLYPWYTLQSQVTTQVELKNSPNNNHDENTTNNHGENEEDNNAIVPATSLEAAPLLAETPKEQTTNF